MKNEMLRRDFLKNAPPAVCIMSRAAVGSTDQDKELAARNVIEPFDYRGVRLEDSRWKEQYQVNRDYYAAISEDDILKGFRASVGLPAPGKTLGGWCERNSATVFGQWLSGMARMYRATGDGAMREKAVRLVTEFAKTVKSDGDCGMRHYPFDKLVCGLVDMQLYADHADSIALLDRLVDWAIKNFDRAIVAATPSSWSGRPGEWYTLGENLFRAYRLTGNPKYRTFAEVWLYPQYWNKFAATSDPANAHGLHAYSHVNTFSSAAMAYAVSGDSAYLKILKNAYDFLQTRQCYATGGFGPIEHIVPSDGALGRALEYRPDDFETVCGSWAGFKLSRYLMQFTGESRYGDWIERLLYNGVGAALPITAGGKNFYYADYRISGGMKIYKRETYTCCSGTLIQCVADYHNLIYFRDSSSLYVNLFLPSEVVWSRPEGEVRLTQETRYPEEETTLLTVNPRQGASFSIKFRAPSWAQGVSAKVNGAPIDVAAQPGTWVAVTRQWNPGDRLEIHIPLRFRTQAVDEQHPKWVAIVRGPVVYVLDAFAHAQNFRLPETDADLNKWLIAEPQGVFHMEFPGGGRVGSKLFPFYSMAEVAPYKMYFDAKSLPFRIW
jgi:uncharacterized protein